MHELAYNLESFNPAFTAVLLKVQRTIGLSDYVRRDQVRWGGAGGRWEVVGAGQQRRSMAHAGAAAVQLAGCAEGRALRLLCACRR